MLNKVKGQLVSSPFLKEVFKFHLGPTYEAEYIQISSIKDYF